ncbi:MAG: 3-hydroxyacyl-CoA dehydrogenase family protein [Burkholderiales bacterium]
MEQVTVIGAGAMGRQIALQCALRGFAVVLNDSRQAALDDALAFYRDYLDGRIAKGKLTDAERSAALARMKTTTSLEEAARDAALVIEAIIEQFEPKVALFKQLDAICPPATLLATNSSNIRGSRLAELTQRPGQVLNLHFFNPALVMELVEVVVHPAVPEAVIEQAMAFCRSIGKTPVLLRKEVPGFLVNRIFRALTREAVSLLEGGYASAEDIDLAVAKGLGHPMGPLRLLDSTGIDVSYLARMDEYQETGVEAAKPNELLKQMYERGEWGKKSGKGFYDYSKKD